MSKNLLIIPGHGAGDSGAVGGGVTEANMVRLLATEMKAWGGSKVRRTEYKRNYFEDGGVERIDKSKYPPSKWRIVELHMDAANGKARGAHVIQCSKRTKAAKRIAKRLAKLLPGRAETHVLNSGLRNPRHGEQCGYDYTLVEVGFIDNKGDREYVQDNMAKVAKAILRACYITPRLKRLNAKCPW